MTLEQKDNRRRLLAGLREEFVSAGRKDISEMSEPKYYAYLLRTTRKQEQMFGASVIISPPLERLCRLAANLRAHNAERQRLYDRVRYGERVRNGEVRYDEERTL